MFDKMRFEGLTLTVDDVQRSIDGEPPGGAMEAAKTFALRVLAVQGAALEGVTFHVGWRRPRP